jgi:N-acetylglutamate synthase-like GNAT family acetyltransferase
LNIEITNCSATHFKLVKKYIKNFELDDRELKQKEFLVAISNGNLLGFGRIREHEGFSEMCSLGIIENAREKGIGKLISMALIKKATQSIYLACIIPNYFKALGFKVCRKFPEGMQQKLDYCTDSLPVPENYVVMKLI